MIMKLELVVFLLLVRKVGRLLLVVGLISLLSCCLEIEVSIGIVVFMQFIVSVSGMLWKWLVEIICFLINCVVLLFGKISGLLVIVFNLMLNMWQVCVQVLCIVLCICGMQCRLQVFCGWCFLLFLNGRKWLQNVLWLWCWLVGIYFQLMLKLSVWFFGVFYVLVVYCWKCGIRWYGMLIRVEFFSRLCMCVVVLI